MKRINLTLLSATTLAVLFIACSKNDDKDGGTPPANVQSVQLTASGDSLAVVTRINEFRLLTGDPLNAAPGATIGRREVNWDAVPANFTNANNFPFDFFGASDPALPNARKRGLILKNTGTSFRVDSTLFADIDASYSSQFQAFSKKRLFTYMGSTITEITFKVPGTNTDAFVKGFGVIFSDVDEAGSTTVEYFNGNKSLGVFTAPVRKANGSFSFVGIGFPQDKVTKVKIKAGNGLLATGVKDVSSGGSKDLVVMDDFIYDEPKALN
jgi:hypothetical protein